MTARLHIKGWSDFQHYKDRSPPWIKLHKGLLDNYEYQMLPIASRALAPMLWLLASESEDGSIDGNPDKIAFRLRATRKEIEDGLRPLIEAGFLTPNKDASAALAMCTQEASLETEAERETEKETEAESSDDPVFIWIPLTGRMRQGITESKIAYYREHYPAVNVEQELRKMVVWCDANPSKRKTKRGINSFIASWLSRAQDSAGQRGSLTLQSGPVAETFRERDQRVARERMAEFAPGVAARPPRGPEPAGLVIDAFDVLPRLEG